MHGCSGRVGDATNGVDGYTTEVARRKLRAREGVTSEVWLEARGVVFGGVVGSMAGMQQRQGDVWRRRQILAGGRILWGAICCVDPGRARRRTRHTTAVRSQTREGRYRVSEHDIARRWMCLKGIYFTVLEG
jgi:hypothetical protein